MKSRQSLWKGLLWVPSLYLAEGLPYVVVMTVAGVMYKRMGMDNADLAFYTSLLSLPWAIKPFWSPFIDIFSSKRRWIVAMQLLIAVGFGAIALALPGTGWFRASMASFMIVAFFSATHDIAADGFYIIALDQRGQSFFVGIRTAVYRLAMLLGQGPLVMLAGALEKSYGDISRAWAMTFYILAGAMAVMALYHALALPRPMSDVDRRPPSFAKVWREVIDTFIGFFTKPGIITALLFIVLYKFPEAQLIRLISPFLLDPVKVGGMGLETGEVGFVYGTVGLVGLIVGGIIGGMVAARGGLRRWLMPMAWSMSLTCLVFVWLAYGPTPSLMSIKICVFIEQFGYGFGTTAYMLYLIQFSRGERATAYYAISTGLMTLGLMLPGMIAGWIQTRIGYGPFFLWTMATCALTIVVSIAARRKLPAN